MNFINHILVFLRNYIYKPIQSNLALFVFYLLLILVVDEYEIVSNGHYPYAVYIFCCGFLTAWLFVFLIEIVHPKWIKTFLSIFFFFISFVGFLTDYLCISVFYERYTVEFAATIIGTNPAEMSEFMSTYITPSFLLVVAISLLLFAFVYKVLQRVILPYKPFYIIVVGLFWFFSILLSVHNTGVLEQSLVGKYMTLFMVSSPPDLNQYRQNPEILVDANRMPTDVVVIIGESFAKSHSSLYGYSYNTNPLLAHLEENSDLIVFDSVISPAVTTVPAFQSIMTTYKPEMGDSINWYECQTLPEIVENAGFKTCWISNQRKLGLMDNVVGKFAELCNSYYFVSDKFSGILEQKYDEDILPILDQSKNLQKKELHSFYFIHLMGSHVSFDKRYPHDFNKFDLSMYSDYPEWQRENRATYDNSILYNDYVVNEIIKRFTNDNAIIFYFSDHGLDFYESKPTYCSHASEARPESKAAGVRIPFMVYMSNKFQELYPDRVDRVRDSKQKFFRTDDFIYSIMDILDIDFVNDNQVSSYSLFKD